MTSHGFILRPCRSLPGQVVRCDSVSLHAVSASFIVRAFSGVTHLCPLLTSPRLSMPVARHFVACCQPTAVETSRGKARHFLRCRRICKVHPNNRRWRTSRSRARSSRVHHASYPVFVHRPAISDWTSFRLRLATTPLPFSLPSALCKPGHRTRTYEVTRHARHSR